ncbi:hypothetical protein TWF281_010373 [Arthrobotrys megalospora]
MRLISSSLVLPFLSVSLLTIQPLTRAAFPEDWYPEDAADNVIMPVGYWYQWLMDNEGTLLKIGDQINSLHEARTRTCPLGPDPRIPARGRGMVSRNSLTFLILAFERVVTTSIDDKRLLQSSKAGTSGYVETLSTKFIFDSLGWDIDHGTIVGRYQILARMEQISFGLESIRTMGIDMWNTFNDVQTAITQPNVPEIFVPYSNDVEENAKTAAGVGNWVAFAKRLLVSGDESIIVNLKAHNQNIANFVNLMEDMGEAAHMVGLWKRYGKNNELENPFYTRQLNQNPNKYDPDFGGHPVGPQQQLTVMNLFDYFSAWNSCWFRPWVGLVSQMTKLTPFNGMTLPGATAKNLVRWKEASLALAVTDPGYLRKIADLSRNPTAEEQRDPASEQGSRVEDEFENDLVGKFESNRELQGGGDNVEEGVEGGVNIMEQHRGTMEIEDLDQIPHQEPPNWESWPDAESHHVVENNDPVFTTAMEEGFYNH